ncbi:MAG: hypothetical protein EU550_03885 [Promethearchaeota archaeon]|nr:MAG: hypothetical protein EU550_03885 [Candidatus Lokiarchaeota archaeon]
MSEEKFRNLISDPGSYDIVRILREGPLTDETIVKYLQKISKFKEKEAFKKLKHLTKENIIIPFKLKNKDYYLLIKDFYIIRIPPKELLTGLQKDKELSKSLKQQYLSRMKSYFSTYVTSSDKLKSDFEKQLIQLVINPEIMDLISVLRKKPLELKTVKKKRPKFNSIKKILLKNDIIEIMEEDREEWVLLKTDFNFEVFFPDYLIKNITVKLKEKKINKPLALTSLYVLKRSYLQNEKPEEYEELMQRINDKRKLVESLEKKGEKNITKAKELIKLFKAIGDYENIKVWKLKLKQWITEK